MPENSNSGTNVSVVQENQNNDDRFVHDWISNLLSQLNSSLSDDTKKIVLKGCSAVHYRAIQMEELVSQYRGNLAGFLQVLSEKWQWKVAYDPVAQVITADENKNDCVCPVVRLSSSLVSEILCHCSEGFAERMFSAVVDGPVKAQVIQSVLRGDRICIYRIQVL